MAEDAAVWLLHALTAAPAEAALFAGSASPAARKDALQACLAAAAACADVDKATALVCVIAPTRMFPLVFFVTFYADAAPCVCQFLWDPMTT